MSSSVSAPTLPSTSDLASRQEAAASVARQVILNAQNSIYGYSFGSVAQRSDGDRIFEALTLSEQQVLARSTTLFIGCTHDRLERGNLDRLPEGNMVLEVPALPVTLLDQAARFVPGLEAAQKQGFKLAFEFAVLTQPYASWLPLATFIKFDLAVLRPEAVANFVTIARARSQATLIAVNVNTLAQRQAMDALGVTLYQGSCFMVPPPMPGAHPSDAHLAALQLMQKVRDESVETEAIEDLLRHQPTLSFQLLRFINSASFGFHGEVKSFRHAVNLMGFQRLFKWSALLLTTSAADAKPSAASMTAIVRGRLMELLASRPAASPGIPGGPAISADDAFVVGVFSMLDVLLGVPLKRALAEVQLPAAVSAALLENSGPLAEWLALVQACERPQTPEFGLQLAALGINSRQLNTAHLQALAWAEALHSS